MKTLQGLSHFHEEVRKSRFITVAAPINNPDEAIAFIQHHSDPAASHNCWAWQCGQAYRFTDDAEPSGTAGRPILAAIQGQDFDQVVVLVTRFYGGIQLGTGGLARAYGGGASKCLQQAPALELIKRIQARCHVPFAELARVKNRLEHEHVLLVSEDFDSQGAWLILALPAEQLIQLTQQLTDLGRGQIQLKAL